MTTTGEPTAAELAVADLEADHAPEPWDLPCESVELATHVLRPLLADTVARANVAEFPERTRLEGQALGLALALGVLSGERATELVAEARAKVRHPGEGLL